MRGFELGLIFLAILGLCLCTEKVGGRSHQNYTPRRFEHVESQIHRRFITLSGHSTGSSFVQAFHLSHSRLVHGSGHFSGFFYKCGNTSRTLEEFYAKCGIPGGYSDGGFKPNPYLADVNTAIQALNDYATKGLVDPLSSLAKHKVWIWLGTLDQWISPNTSSRIVDIFSPPLNSPSQIQSVIMRSAHHVPTVKNGGICESVDDYSVGACKYDGPTEMLRFLISRRGYQVGKPETTTNLQPLLKFDQTRFFVGQSKPIGLDKTGYLYIPSGCQTSQNRCHLHLFFHGCFNSKSAIGSKQVRQSGFLEAAERNSIIVIFPQATETKENPHGCWDSFGYTGPDFGNQRGKQIQIVKKMIDAFMTP